MKTALIFGLCIALAGCASRAPIDQAVVLNKSVVKQAAAVSRFSEYPGVEGEQSQIKEATEQFTRDLGLVRGCLKNRGGIANPICRADAREVENRVTWINASAGRGIDDVDHSPKASEKTKRKARKAFGEIQTRAQSIDLTLDRGGLLVRRNSTAHPPPRHLVNGEKSQLNSQRAGCAAASRSEGTDRNDTPCPSP